MNTSVGNTSTAGGGAANATPLDWLLFAILAAVTCARPLISESFQHAGFSFLPDTARGTTPATTVWLDGILLATAVVAWCRRWRGGLRPNAVSIGLGLLLIAVIVSVAAAHDKRAAANAGANLFVIVFAGTALARLMRTRRMVYVLIAAVLAGGATNAAKCMMQRAYEFSDTIEDWQQRKPELIAAGIDPNSPDIVNFERRMRSTEAFGYLSHPNVTASCLSMCALLAVGGVVALVRGNAKQRGKNAATITVGGVLVTTMCVGLWLTGSLGGAVAAGAGAVLLVLSGVWRGRIAERPRAAFMMLVVAYVGVIGAGAALGLARGTLPHTSLAFRWQYWRAAARAFRDAPLTGIGRENFQAAYMLHKSPESTEEVGNPHNLWVSLLVELGPLGLIAGILLVSAATFHAVRAAGDNRGRAPPKPSASAMAAIAAGVLLVQAIASGEFRGTSGDLLISLLILWGVGTALVWVAAFFIAYSLAARADEHAGGRAWLAGGLLAALAAALVHNLIGFSLLTPPGLSIFVALAVCAYAFCTQANPAPDRVGKQHPPRFAPAGVTIAVCGVVSVAAYVQMIAWPSIRGDTARREFRIGVKSARTPANLDRVLHQARRLADVDRWDADLPRSFAGVALQFSERADAPEEYRRAWLGLARELAETSRVRDVYSFATLRLLAEICDAGAVKSNTPAALAKAANAWDAAVAAYPTNPRARISAGEAWFRVWKQTGSAAEGRRAAEHFAAALAIDDTRLPEVAAKLHTTERERVGCCLKELHAAGLGSE